MDRRLARTIALATFVAVVSCAHQGPRDGPVSMNATPWVDPSPHRSWIVSANGIDIHVLDWGGSGDAVVLLAGLGNTAHVFDSLAPRLTSEFHVVSFTRRGFGESSHPASGYETASLVEDVRGALDALGISKAHFVGHSVAGDEISGFAARYPERVGRLVYLDAAYDRAELRRLLATSLFTNPKPPSPPKPKREERASVEAYTGYLQRIHGVRWPEAEVRATRRFDAQGRYDKDVASGVTNLRILRGEERPRYEKIAAPALALYAVQESVEDAYPWGFPNPLAKLKAWNWHKGRWIPFAREQRELFDRQTLNGTVEILPAPHFLFLSNESEVASRIRSFLAAG